MPPMLALLVDPTQFSRWPNVGSQCFSGEAGNLVGRSELPGEALRAPWPMMHTDADGLQTQAPLKTHYLKCYKHIQYLSHMYLTQRGPVRRCLLLPIHVAPLAPVGSVPKPPRLPALPLRHQVQRPRPLLHGSARVGTEPGLHSRPAHVCCEKQPRGRR